MDFVFKFILVAAFLRHVKVQSASRVPRLSVAESSPSNYYFYNNIEGNPGVYSFNYDVSDSVTGNNQYRTEDRYANGTVTGTYGYIDPYGTPLRFRYVADQAGYRVFRDNLFKPFIYGYQTTLQPIDKNAIQPTEPSITWSRPKRPNKNRIQSNKLEGFVKGTQRKKYNLKGPASSYVAYD